MFRKGGDGNEIRLKTGLATWYGRRRAVSGALTNESVGGTEKKLSSFLTPKQVRQFMEIAKDLSMMSAIPYDVACDQLYTALFAWPLPRVPWWKRLINKVRRKT